MSGLLPHTVRAVDASPSMSVFEVDEARGAAHPPDECASHVPLGEMPHSDELRRTDRSAACETSLWLAGHVEAFNIPGTNAQAGGLRFLPSCYRWQLTSG